ncbi:gamma-glutamyltransferase [Alteromonas pelagimontana]|uniref:Glutathione hydrolase proenzyme n=1 Tax=Alteromonas pelagimontana TaxID=1858656 RepID=A0A6M4MB96_9ALTE|nr:gamma-glutamyltransferase [Alteromonas pelagimontana]QJR80484.1 gamma-glutamyltransferase [Alteromonas pelagimontana]
MRLLSIYFFTVWLIGCSAGTATNPDLSSASINGQQAVAMPDAFSADAAMAVMDDGGNAIDAAIAAEFVLAVTLPEAGNIGGGGFMTIYHDHRPMFLDYREMAPGSADRDMYLNEQGQVVKMDSLFGARASGVPGTVAGMWAAHQKFGKLPWKRLVQPAVELAEQGFVVPKKLAERISDQISRAEKRDINSNFNRYFAHAKAGTVFKQPELASTLKRIRDEGKEGFYAGETAQAIVQYMQKNNGLITQNDLSRYEAKWRQPVRYHWRGYTLVTAPPPSSGGVAVAQWIGMLDDVLENTTLPAQNSASYVHLMAEIGKRVFADRAEYMGDPDFVNVPVSQLIDQNYIDKRANEVTINNISATEDVKPGLYESPQTTHFSVMDQWGNAVSNTTTLNLLFGNAMVVEGAGFLLNDEMDDFSAKAGVPNFFGAVGGTANEIQPYKRMLSSMTPTIVLKDNEVQLVTGSPGGTTIISSATQSLLNALLFDMTAEEAVNAPRFHHQLLPKDTIAYHEGLSQQVIAELEAMGYTMKQSNFGDVQLIKRTATGLEAASEARGRGKSIVAAGGH